MSLIGEWSETLSAFWYGANGCEYVAWKGSNQVFEFPTWKYPSPPARVIQYGKRIETLQDFTKALNSGRWLKASYEEESR